MLLELVLTKFFKRELFSCLPKVGHVIKSCKEPLDTLNNSSDFVTSASCVPDAQKSPKTQNNSWHASRKTQRTIDRLEDSFLVEYPVRVISVAVL